LLGIPPPRRDLTRPRTATSVSGCFGTASTGSAARSRTCWRRIGGPVALSASSWELPTRPPPAPRPRIPGAAEDIACSPPLTSACGPLRREGRVRAPVPLLLEQQGPSSLDPRREGLRRRKQVPMNARSSPQFPKKGSDPPDASPPRVGAERHHVLFFPRDLLGATLASRGKPSERQGQPTWRSCRGAWRW